jgi:DegV family protein with EDD domain
MILERYPEAQIEVVDSRSNSMELGFAVLAGAKAAKAGQPLLEVVREIDRMIRRTRFVFAPEVLDYLRKGGRIGGAAALLGSLLQIKPILTVNNGKTAVLAKVRTKARAFEEMIRVFLDDVRQKGLGEVYIHHINNESGAHKMSELIKKSFDCPISICSIGPVIGLHVGPGTLGLVYYTNEDLR